MSDRASLLSLSDDVLLPVLSLLSVRTLSATGCVCRRLAAIAADEELWRRHAEVVLGLPLSRLNKPAWSSWRQYVLFRTVPPRVCAVVPAGRSTLNVLHGRTRALIDHGCIYGVTDHRILKYEPSPTTGWQICASHPLPAGNGWVLAPSSQAGPYVIACGCSFGGSDTVFDVDLHQVTVLQQGTNMFGGRLIRLELVKGRQEQRLVFADRPAAPYVTLPAASEPYAVSGAAYGALLGRSLKTDSGSRLLTDLITESIHKKSVPFFTIDTTLATIAQLDLRLPTAKRSIGSVPDSRLTRNLAVFGLGSERFLVSHEFADDLTGDTLEAVVISPHSNETVALPRCDEFRVTVGNGLLFFFLWSMDDSSSARLHAFNSNAVRLWETSVQLPRKSCPSSVVVLPDGCFVLKYTDPPALYLLTRRASSPLFYGELPENDS